jgi:hypothetical protein
MARSSDIFILGILRACVISTYARSVIVLLDSLLGSDVAPISIRHKEITLKHIKILHYLCQYGHGYVTLPLQDGSSTFIIEKTNRLGLKTPPLSHREG